MDLCDEMIVERLFERADSFYSALLSVLPEDYRIRLGYAISCIMNDRTSFGLSLMRELWSRYPERKTKDLEILAFQLRRRQRASDELELRRFIVDEFPESANVLYYLAEAYSYYGEKDRAIEECERALRLRPDYGDAETLMKKLESEETGSS